MKNVKTQMSKELWKQIRYKARCQLLSQVSNKVILQVEGEVFEQVSGQLYQSFGPNLKMTILNHNYSSFLEKLNDYGY